MIELARGACRIAGGADVILVQRSPRAIDQPLRLIGRASERCWPIRAAAGLVHGKWGITARRAAGRGRAAVSPARWARLAARGLNRKPFAAVTDHLADHIMTVCPISASTVATSRACCRNSARDELPPADLADRQQPCLLGRAQTRAGRVPRSMPDDPQWADEATRQTSSCTWRRRRWRRAATGRSRSKTRSTGHSTRCSGHAGRGTGRNGWS